MQTPLSDFARTWDAEGQRGAAREPDSSSWSVRTEDRRYYGASAPSGSLPGLTAVFLAPLSCLVSSLHFVPCRAGSSHRSQPGRAVCRSSEDVTYLSPASLWVCARSGFTFISPARASDCRGGQGQLGVGPQPRKVPWSGLVPSRPHQPWGIAPAERPAVAPGCLLAVPFRKARDPVRAAELSVRGKAREVCYWFRLRECRRRRRENQTQDWREAPLLSAARLPCNGQHCRG